jgi:hypothetical protein
MSKLQNRRAATAEPPRPASILPSAWPSSFASPTRRCWANAIPGNGGFGQTAAEFRPLRFQNDADFGAHGLGHAAQHAQGMPLMAGHLPADLAANF